MTEKQTMNPEQPKKIKTVTNRGDMLGGLLGITILYLFFLGGLFYQYHAWSALVLFLAIECISIYTGIRKIKTVTFFSDRVVVESLFGGPPVTVNATDPAVKLWLPNSTVHTGGNRVALQFGDRKAVGFQLNDSEWELEEFYDRTLNSGYRWQIGDHRKKAHERDYELYLQRKKQMDAAMKRRS